MKNGHLARAQKAADERLAKSLRRELDGLREKAAAVDPAEFPDWIEVQDRIRLVEAELGRIEG